MSNVTWRTHDWRQLVAAADPKPTYYDKYRFNGRTFKQRDITNYIPHEATIPPPTYTTLDPEE